VTDLIIHRALFSHILFSVFTRATLCARFSLSSYLRNPTLEPNKVDRMTQCRGFTIQNFPKWWSATILDLI